MYVEPSVTSYSSNFNSDYILKVSEISQEQYKNIVLEITLKVPWFGFVILNFIGELAIIVQVIGYTVS